MRHPRGTLALLLGLAALAAPAAPVAAEPGQTGRFLIAGYGDVTYVDATDSTSETAVGFSPIFLFRLSDKLHVEAEVEFGLEDEGALEIEFEYANIHYYLTDSTTLTAGKFLLPFANFGLNLHPSWINKLPMKPAIYGEHGNGSLDPMLPVLSDLGVSLQQTFRFGSSTRLTLDLFAVNGPSEEGEGDETALGVLDGDGDEEGVEVELEARPHDNNNDKALGGRLGLGLGALLDAGLSYYRGAYDDEGELTFTASAVDLNLTGRHWKVRSEFVQTQAEFFEEAGPGHGPTPGPLHHGDPASGHRRETFDRSGYWIEGSLGLAQFNVPALSRFEVVLRYDELLQALEGTRMTVGLNYWAGASAVIKTAFARDEPHEGPSTDRVFVQFSYGF